MHRQSHVTDGTDKDFPAFEADAPGIIEGTGLAGILCGQRRMWAYFSNLRIGSTDGPGVFLGKDTRLI